MKLTLVSAGLLLSSTLLLNACSTPNQVAQHVETDALIEQVTEGKYQGMYRNVYRQPLGKRQY
ncbi:MAG: Zn-dependent hydrolase, partial [Gammaproteobacteria bacterium]|nr:Zn-dependent hydrolase [Gammaproteobacteria bacterium]